MADSTKALLICVIWSLVSTEITSEQPKRSDQPLISDFHQSLSLRDELDQFISRISSLESIIHERTQELISKEESIRKMEMVIQDKSDTIMMLQSEIQSFQLTESSSAKKFKSKEHEQAYELEKQVFRLKREIELQNQKKLRLETRANDAEKKVTELSLKLDYLLTVSNEQTKRIQEAESSLRGAQEQLMKMKLQAPSTSKFTEVGTEWLPHWLVVHLTQLQSYTVTQWNQHIQPALYATVNKALEMKDDLKEWCRPHIETLDTKGVPAIKEIWVTFATYLELKVDLLATKSVEVYHASNHSLAQVFAKALDISDVYVQKVRKHAEPYIGHAVKVATPHLDKACVVLKPYAEKINHAYWKLAKAATGYHRWAQELLKDNEITRPLATTELAWFVATGLLSFPLMVLVKLCSTLLSGTKPKKYNRRFHTVQTQQRRAKRRYHDK